MVPVGERHVDLKAIIGRLLIKDATLRPNAKDVVAGTQRICALLGFEARDDTPPPEQPFDTDDSLPNDQCSNMHSIRNDIPPHADASPPGKTADYGDAEFYPSDFETYMDSDDSDDCCEAYCEAYDDGTLSQRRPNKHLGSSSEVKIYVSVSRNYDGVYKNTKGESKHARCAHKGPAFDKQSAAATAPSSTMTPSQVSFKGRPTTTKSQPSAISTARGRTKSGSDRKSFKSVSEISSPPRSASTWDYLLERAEQARQQLQRSTSTADASKRQETSLYLQHHRAHSSSAASKQVDGNNGGGSSAPGHQRAIKTIIASASRLLHKSQSRRNCQTTGETVGDKACQTDGRQRKPVRAIRQGNQAKRVGASATTVLLFAHSAERATEVAAKRALKQQSTEERAENDASSTYERPAQKSPPSKRTSGPAREPCVSAGEMPPTSTPGATKPRPSLMSRAKTPSAYSQIGQRRDALLHQPPTPPPNATYRGTRRGSFDDELDLETHPIPKIHHQHAAVPPPPHHHDSLGAFDPRASSLAVTRRRTYDDLPVNFHAEFAPTRRRSLDDRPTLRSPAVQYEVEEQAIRPRGSSTFSSVDAAQVRLKLGEKAFYAVCEVFRSAHERGIC